jgi:hypothetical protein
MASSPALKNGLVAVWFQARDQKYVNRVEHRLTGTFICRSGEPKGSEKRENYLDMAGVRSPGSLCSRQNGLVPANYFERLHITACPNLAHERSRYSGNEDDFDPGSMRSAPASNRSRNLLEAPQ